MSTAGFLDYLLMGLAMGASWVTYYIFQVRPEQAAAQRAAVGPKAAEAGTQGPFDAVLTAAGADSSVEFLQGARIAYERIVKAFDEGRVEKESALLTDDVYEAFAGAIRERERVGIPVDMVFAGVKSAEIVDASLEGSMARVSVRFTGLSARAARNERGDVIFTDRSNVVETIDIWTFRRLVSTTDPNWKLAATEAEPAD